MIRRPHLLALTVLTFACGTGGKPPGDEAALHGGKVNPHVPKPEFTLTAADGSAFDFRAETDGYLTLLFFGYTNCPDVCPLHMARIGQALRQVDPAVAEQVKTVFVSVDPERDTPERIGQWLANFHDRFIGVRGDLEEINRIVSELKFIPTTRTQLEDGYGINHPGVVIAYTPDNVGRFIYFLGLSAEDWAEDLPLLVNYDWSE